MEKAAPVTTLCGQLAALKTQTLHVKPREGENEGPKSFPGTVKTVAAPVFCPRSNMSGRAERRRVEGEEHGVIQPARRHKHGLG